MTDNAIVSFNNLQAFAGTKTLLDIPALNISKGKITGLLGANGAGKSTLLKTLSGDMPYQGQIQFDGSDLKHWPLLERARHLGVLPQSSQLSFSFRAEEVVALGLTPLSLDQRTGRAQIEKFMRLTDSWRLADQAYPALSGGERQRVHLARVLLQLSQAEQPPLLLLDEPTSAQDLGQQHQILQLIRQLCTEQGYSVIVILHDLNQVLRYCQHCCLLHNGQLVLEGTPSEVLTPATVDSYWHYRPQPLTSAEGHPVLV